MPSALSDMPATRSLRGIYHFSSRRYRVQANCLDDRFYSDYVPDTAVARQVAVLYVSLSRMSTQPNV
ncbi:hypothetical protein BDZ89DRAFT_1063069 [Hymenopellis radicata]|nr:hypothetical protein BDZ89DRAFT_1063069 [Hymenopellis radicata]